MPAPDIIAGESSPTQLRGWLAHENARGLRASSQQLQWYALHTSYRSLSTLGLTGPSPLDHERPPRALPVARQDYTADEVEANTEAARATAQDGNRREQFDDAVLSTLRYTDIRRTELMTLCLSDLEIHRTRLSVPAKATSSGRCRCRRSTSRS